MKIIYTKSFNKIAKNKYPKSETEPTNPWAVCNKSTGGKKKDPDKFERCVKHVKKQNKEEKSAGIDDMKDVRGRSFQFRSDDKTDKDFDRNIHDEMSGKADSKKSQELDDVWLDALRKQKERKQEPVFSF